MLLLHPTILLMNLASGRAVVVFGLVEGMECQLSKVNVNVCMFILSVVLYCDGFSYLLYSSTISIKLLWTSFTSNHT